MTVKLACVTSWLLRQSSHLTSPVTSRPLIVALDCWSLVVVVVVVAFQALLDLDCVYTFFLALPPPTQFFCLFSGLV